MNKSTTRSTMLRLICPNTGTNALLNPAKCGVSAADFSALLFRGSPLVAPDGTRFDVSFTFHNGWVQMTLYCQRECAAMAAMASHPGGRKEAATFMSRLSRITGWNKPWPALQKSRHPLLLAFFDKPFLKRTTPGELQMALNALTMAGCGLLQHICRNAMASASPKRFPPVLRIGQFPVISSGGKTSRLQTASLQRKSRDTTSGQSAQKNHPR